MTSLICPEESAVLGPGLRPREAHKERTLEDTSRQESVGLLTDQIIKYWKVSLSFNNDKYYEI